MDNNIFIGDINGKLWSAEEWDNSAIPNGIVYKSDGRSFVMALQNEGTKKISVDLKFEAPEMVKHSNVNDAIHDFKGKENTELMADFYGTDPNYAVGAALSYTFPNGEKGYLPSAGELNLLLENIAYVEDLLALSGGQSILDGAIITSTRGVDFSSGQVSYWFWIKSNGWTNWAGIDGNFTVRAFSPYIIKKEKSWNVGGGNIYIKYEGEGNGSVDVYSDNNEGIDRETKITIDTTNGNNPKSVEVVVKQNGLREMFMSNDGKFLLTDGGTFNVLKNEL